MSKLNFCADGTPVTEKVLKCQKTRSSEDYLQVLNYYSNYKDRWYGDIQDYIDRETFDADFEFKLCRAIDTFDIEQALVLCEQYKWSSIGAFNRWFYAVLRNWKSNVKTSAYRQKNRPAVTCPVCGRSVQKIDEFHLAHYKTKSDFPRAFTWKGNIYSVEIEPGMHAYCWGEYGKVKLHQINNDKSKNHKRNLVAWPWFLPDGSKGVMCPFTHKMVSVIDFEYIKSLPNKFNRYARPVSWQDFVEEFPFPMLIQSEIYSLDYHTADKDMALRDNIAIEQQNESLSYEDLDSQRVTPQYEHAFYLIDQHIPDEVDRKILKLISIGYMDEDIAHVIGMDRKEVRNRKKNMKTEYLELYAKLLEV